MARWQSSSSLCSCCWPVAGLARNRPLPARVVPVSPASQSSTAARLTPSIRWQPGAIVRSFDWIRARRIAGAKTRSRSRRVSAREALVSLIAGQRPNGCHHRKMRSLTDRARSPTNRKRIEHADGLSDIRRRGSDVRQKQISQHLSGGSDNPIDELLRTTEIAGGIGQALDRRPIEARCDHRITF